MKNIKELTKYSFLFFLLVIVDQWSKMAVYGKTPSRVFKNNNFAFSLNVPVPLMYGIYIVLLGALIFWFAKKQQKQLVTKLGFVLVLAGALSNILERVVRGYVIDFIHIHTGVLNLADFFIILGILVLLLENDIEPKKVS